jgi:hypothetical protein
MLLFHTVRSPCFGTRIVDLRIPLLIRIPLILPCFVYAVMNLVFDVFFTMVTNFSALYACLIDWIKVFISFLQVVCFDVVILNKCFYLVNGVFSVSDER